MSTVLRGQKVTLREIDYDDTDLIVRWRNNPLVQKNFIYAIPRIATCRRTA